MDSPKDARSRSDDVPAAGGHLEQLSLLMDGAFRIPGVGWRFGLDSVVGLIPGLGDSVGAIVSFYILAAAVRYRVPKITLVRMTLNLGLDYALGAIPVVGDAFDLWWKANQRNVALLRRDAEDTVARAGRAGDWAFVVALMALLVALLAASLVAAAWLLAKAFKALG